ncbi:hypothetical protein [Pedobacter punctiformis]|uniref:DUF4476 domain-containing protein n=1 Tax=Pedobacter punctiformis TaxID=3004097 RepID=A0ABT4LDP7_9SPHI|nr:hypothetical protein [Pedobacter sp. HCMS5-2]MCZ4245298.1 hypothetical protein [Pedobacter sp. HCMS5-2]
MKRYLFICLLLASVTGFAQNTINNYKYVIVPEKFSFLKQSNQYDLNSLTKLFLEEKGFKVYYDNADLPTEIANNKCSALIADLLEKNSMFTTNVTFLLKDCKGNILFKSKEGKSREKEYKISYNLALRDAFTSLNEVQYAYNGTTIANEQTNTAPAPVAAQSAQITPLVATTAVAQTPVAEAKQPDGTLYAQPIANGYQLINTAPKIVLTLFKTSAAEYFIASNGTANGIVLKKNGDWFFEYYQNDKRIAEKLLIKF